MSDTTTAQPEIPEDWTERLKANDEKVLKAIYAANYGKVEKYVLDNNGSEADAGDIFQEAFIVVWRNIQLNRVLLTTPDKLQGYLFRIAQYKWLDQLRNNKRQKLNAPVIMNYEEAETYIEKEEEQYLEKVKIGYAGLGEPCKDILHRFYFLKQSMNEIAAAFSWTDATAKNNKYRCLQRLRDKVIPKKTMP